MVRVFKELTVVLVMAVGMLYALNEFNGYVDNDPRVEAISGIIEGVALATEGDDLNGSHADIKGLEMLAALGQDATIKAFMDHSWTTGTRPAFAAEIGVWKNIRLDTSGDKAILRGDLHVLPTRVHEQWYRTFMYMLKKYPKDFGTSVVFMRAKGQEKHKTSGKRLWRPIRWMSCDLVVIPAANPGGLW